MSLVAHRPVTGPVFARSVIVLIDYTSSRGATGLVMNKPTPIRIGDLVGAMKGMNSRHDVVWIAGPVQPEVAWVVHTRGDLDASGSLIRDGLWLGGDIELLTNIAKSSTLDPSPTSFRFMRGYAGWAKGQLESEINEGSWDVVDLEAATLLGTPAEDLWDDAMARAELPFPLPPNTLSNFRSN